MRKSEGKCTKLYPYIFLYHSYTLVWKTDAGMRLCVFAFTFPRPYLPCLHTSCFCTFYVNLGYTFRPEPKHISKLACSNTFHHACYSGHSDVVEKLVSECGCDVNASNCSMVKRMSELRFKTSNYHN